jgi:hypothetical protein
VTFIPSDPGVGGGAEYLAAALAAHPDVDREAVYRKVEQLTHPRPGVERDPDNVILDVARRLWQGQSWEDVLEQLPRD